MSTDLNQLPGRRQARLITPISSLRILNILLNQLARERKPAQINFAKAMKPSAQIGSVAPTELKMHTETEDASITLDCNTLRKKVYKAEKQNTA